MKRRKNLHEKRRHTKEHCVNGPHLLITMKHHHHHHHDTKSQLHVQKEENNQQ
jgi:hypothetical protein